MWIIWISLSPLFFFDFSILYKLSTCPSFHNVKINFLLFSILY